MPQNVELIGIKLILRMCYLWFITNKDVVVHGLWDVVDVEI